MELPSFSAIIAVVASVFDVIAKCGSSAAGSFITPFGVESFMVSMTTVVEKASFIKLSRPSSSF